MSERLDALIEMDRRGILTGPDKAALDEMRRRGMIPGTQASTLPPDSVMAPERSTYQRIEDYVTGRGKKIEGVGEFSTPTVMGDPVRGQSGYFDPMKQLAFTGGFAVADTPQAKIDIIKKNIPGAQFGADENGNPMVMIPGRPWEYLNAPGLSGRDVVDTIAKTAGYIMGGRAGAGPAKSLIGRAIGTGLGTSAGSIGMDELAAAGGSREGVNLPMAGIAGITGGLFELASPAVSAIVRAMKSGRKMPTPGQARVILQDLGYDLNNVSDEMLDIFTRKAAESVDPTTAARIAQAQSLPVPVPNTRGMATGKASDQMFEDMALKGAYGQGPEDIMRGAYQRTDEALRANVPEIQQRIGGGQIGGIQQSGPRVQEALIKQAEPMRAAIGEAYGAARAASAGTPADLVRQIGNTIESEGASFLPFAPKAQSLAAEFKAMGEAAGPADVMIKSLFDWRRRVSELAANAPDRTEAAALVGMKRSFDNQIKQVAADSLMSGDENAIALWRDAIGKRAEYGKIFESDDLVSSLVETEYKGGGARLKVAPEAASNFIFGASNTGLIGKPQMYRELTKMRKLLGPESPEWNAIREEAWLRLAGQAEGAFYGGQRSFSGVGLKKAVDDMAKRNPEVFNLFFPGADGAMIKNFADVSARLTNPVKGGQNFSNTAVGISKLLQSMSGALFMGEKGRAVLSRITPRIYEAIQQGPAWRAARGSVPLPGVVPGTTGAIGTSGTMEYLQQ